MSGTRITTALPLTEAVAVVPDDNVVFEPSVIYVGTGGTVTVRPAESRADVQYTMPSGSTIPVLVTSVRATGTAALLMVRSF